MKTGGPSVAGWGQERRKDLMEMRWTFRFHRLRHLFPGGACVLGWGLERGKLS